MPESWLGPGWPAALGLALVATVLTPLLALPGKTLVAPRAVPSAIVLVSVGVVLGAYGLLVAALVGEDRRLRWMAGGFAMAAVAMLGRAAALRDGDPTAPQALWLAAQLALPLTALTVVLSKDLRLLVAPLALLSLLTTAVWQADEPVLALDALPVFVGAVATLSWLRTRRRAERLAWDVTAVALALATASSAVRLVSDREYRPGFLLLEGAGLALPGLVLGVLAATYHRQVRRWQRMEDSARRLRSRTALLPGRSITPDDDEGLPDEAAVKRLLAGTVGLALQPVIDLATGDVVGKEALARFGGREPTDRWFRAAGVHGMGAQLELLTLSAAMAQRPFLEPGQFLAVNVSPLALDDREVLDLLLSQDLVGVLVEITEHDAVSDYERLRSTLAALRDRGARIAVDDTGAGFASLRHVLMLQPDVVKLDVALTREASDPRQAALVKALVAFAREVGMVVLAEGVEVPDQVRVLLDLGVTLGQGWHLGVPVTVMQPELSPRAL